MELLAAGFSLTLVAGVLLVSTSAGSLISNHNGQGWTKLKPGAQSFFQDSKVGVGPQSLGPFFCFPRQIIRELDWQWSSQGRDWLQYGMLPSQDVA